MRLIAIKTLLLSVLFLFMVGSVFAADYIYHDHSNAYEFNLGDGNSILVVGSENTTISLPAADNKEIVPNQITFSGDMINFVLMRTEIISDGVQKYEKIVLRLPSDVVVEGLKHWEQ